MLERFLGDILMLLDNFIYYQLEKLSFTFKTNKIMLLVLI